jgi:hypothetical protein
MHIITFYDKKIKPLVVDLQQKVFNKYGFTINQIMVENWTTHGDAVDNYLKDINDPEEIIVLFDVDAIPLNKKIIPMAVEWAKNNIGLFGNSQVAPNLKPPHNKFIYAAPSFLVFSIRTYNELGRPSFNTTQRSDCGGELSHIAKEKGLPINLLLPNYAEDIKFDLDGYHSFGHGTTYGNNTYHAFESRFGKKDVFFINKCNSILGV